MEAKLRVPDVAALRARLAAAGVALGPAVQQEDTFFRRPGNDPLAADEALRLRRSAGGFELTYKGPRQAGSSVKARSEESVALQDDPTRLLAAMGYDPTAQVRKRRESAHVDGVTLALDDVAGLGWFVELEVVCEPDAVAAARTAIADAARRLGLADAQTLSESYVEMLTRAGRTRPPAP